jgi:hypothetical protein
MGDMVDGRGFVSTADLETGLCGVGSHIVPFMSALSAQMNYSITLTACTRNFCACCFLTLCYIPGVGKSVTRQIGNRRRKYQQPTRMGIASGTTGDATVPSRFGE